MSRVIERYVFVKLRPEHATLAGRAEVCARARELAEIPGVCGVVAGMPADEAALSAWDVSLVVRFGAIAEVPGYLADPRHVDFYEGFLKPRAQVIKAWNFEV
jgi:hypothetical protein